MYVMFVEVHVKPESRERFLEIAMENARKSVESEPGCLRFDVLSYPTDANLFYYYEVFRDAEAYAAHGKRPHGPWYQEAMRSIHQDRDRVHHVASSIYSADPEWTHG
jgi:autoinducer 2-degrading protein